MRTNNQNKETTDKEQVSCRSKKTTDKEQVSSPKAIVVTGLSRQYPDKTAVDNISFSVDKGSIFSLLGVNGAGKTTTIKMLCGLTRPTGGEAYVLSHNIHTELDEVKKLVNISPQDTSVASRLTVRENLEFIAGIYGAGRKKQREKADEMIQYFHLQEVADRRAKVLSGGWQRKLSIAMALITEPQIIFLDEPTLGLDVLARRELWEVIRRMKEKITIILTTHYMEEAESLSDKVAVMVDGQIKAMGSVKELKEQTGADNLEEAFVRIAQEGGARS
ncbi:MAG: ATP-binding cassette domain-containing protein [Lachnospiraceae bacterium]|nr:ATP-binding cassette domain-containing protein [Lachnospiraceae bacterium]